MISDWKFRIAVCLIISTYVIGINADGENSHRADQEFKFFAKMTVKGDENKRFQIECGPQELCDKANITIITCTGNLTSPIENKTSTVDYICSSYPKVEDQKLEWSYKVHSLEGEKDVTNENSWVEIKLQEADASKETPASTPKPIRDSNTSLANKKVRSFPAPNLAMPSWHYNYNVMIIIIIIGIFVL